jgi:CSLREA domain-containing protein
VDEIRDYDGVDSSENVLSRLKLRNRKRARRLGWDRNRLFRPLRVEPLEDRRLLSLTTRLDDPQALVGDVLHDFQISPDSQFGVLRADRETDEVFELYSVNFSTGTLTKLNDPLVAGGDIESFKISPDSSRVVYIADQETKYVHELYSTSIAASGSTKLNDALVAGDVQSFQISPDSNRVVYTANQDTDTIIEIYSAAIDATGSTKLNSSMQPNGDVQRAADFDGFQISPDSSRVVYLADQDTDDVVEIYSAAIAVSGSTKLNSAMQPNGTVDEESFQISPDSSHLVYRADQDTDNLFELYSAAIATSGSTKLNDPSSDDVTQSFQISPDSSRVVFIARDNGFKLYSAAIDATGSTKLNSAIVTGGGVQSGFQISPDSSRVVYRADQDTEGVDELYSAAIDATGSTKLNDPLIDGGNVAKSGFQISADGSRVVYRADQDTNGVAELYSTAITATGSTKLNEPLVEGGDVFEFKISPDSSRVLYTADQDTNDVGELYSAAIDATGSTKLNGRVRRDGNVADFQITPDSSRVVYRADQHTDEVFELYSAAIAATGSTKLNSAMQPNGDMGGDRFQISPDSSRVVYLADQDTDEVFELYGAAIAASGSTNLAPIEALGDNVRVGFGALNPDGSFALSPDGQFAVYIADQNTDDIEELYSVEIATGTVTRLNDPLVSLSSDVKRFQITPDSTRVVYTANQDNKEAVELYSAAIDATGSTKLNDPLAEGSGDVDSFQISQDSSRVVYIADQDTRGTEELYSVAITGGGSIRLNDPLSSPAGQCVCVEDFQISPDSSRVIYRVHSSSQIIALNSAAIAASGSSINLNDDLRGEVESFQISPDGNHVVFIAGDDLYSLAIDGGNPTRLDDPLTEDSSVADFQISPNGRRVVYRADQDTNGVTELYGVAFDAGGSTKLNSAMHSDGDVSSFQISPDSRRVVYIADQDTNGVKELYSAAIAASGSTKLNSALVASGAVSDFQISPNSSRVVYRADQDTDGVIELYSAPITRMGSTKLNDPLIGDVSIFQIGPDSTRVIYRAQQDSSKPELYSAAIAATGSTKLNDGDSADAFLISADSRRVLYRGADQHVDSQIGLYTTIPNPPIEVNTVADTADANPGDGVCDDGTGKCTLRAAIEEANQLPNLVGADVIRFDIQSTEPHLIRPLTPFPELTDSVIIDGTSEPDFDPATHQPVIEIDGTNAGAGSSGFTISSNGGGSVIRGLAINSFDAHGVFISRRDDVTVEHNFIGTDTTGSIDRGNGGAGVYVINAEHNVVRQNVISGNDLGVKIEGPQSTNNTVIGNLIGTMGDGTAELKNRLTGVEIAGSPGNTIGGTALGDRNTISGSREGVAIRGSAATGNVVIGNFIGTDSAGTSEIGNTRGVHIVDGDGNTVGGAGGAANVISGNTKGVEINRGSGNLVHGNFIGTNAAGDAALGNVRGLLVRNAAGNRIGNEPNVISGNTREGVKIFGASSTGNVVRDNRIGTNLAGDAAIANREGVIVTSDAEGNTIGGTTAAERNVISGNTTSGVFLLADNNTVIGNLIGTNLAGTAAIANKTGVFVRNSSGNTIGGSVSGGESNLISGNTEQGLLVTGNNVANTTIAGNAIGTNLAGTAAVANKHGVRIENGAHTIGGATADDGNVISGNSRNGVYIIGAGADGNLLQNNRLGINIDGSGAVPNERSGVLIENAPNNMVGNATAGNSIGGNAQQGVKISGAAATGNLVQNNAIGTDGLTMTEISNRDGIRISDGASGNTIGGDTDTTANDIAHNTGRGVWISGGTANTVSQNSIHDNGALGISIGAQSATSNDPDTGSGADADIGANNLQNTPDLTTVTLSAGNLSIAYSMSSAAANSAYPITVEFFLTDAGGEGGTFLGTDNIAGPGADTANIPAGPAALGSPIVATATDSGGNTSEFSAAVNVAAPLLAAGGEAPSAYGQDLTDVQLSQVGGIAVARLSELGLSANLFANVEFAIADLPGATLGLATPTTVTIDVNAAGWGWAVSDRQSANGNPKTIDLLTVVMHELGHTVGMEDLYDEAEKDDLMYAWLEGGARKTLLESSIADEAFALF